MLEEDELELEAMFGDDDHRLVIDESTSEKTISRENVKELPSKKGKTDQKTPSNEMEEKNSDENMKNSTPENGQTDTNASPKKIGTASGTKPKGKFTKHEKKYSCELCDKSYTQSHSLKSHVKIVHDGKKEFNCADCGKSFGRKQKESLRKYEYGRTRNLSPKISGANAYLLLNL